MNNVDQIIKYARVATGVVRIARQSQCPGALVERALVMAERLIDVSRTLTEERESMKCWRAGVEVQNMVKRSFGPMFFGGKLL